MKIRMLGTRVGIEGAGDQQGGGEAAEAVPDAALVDRAGGIRLVAGRNGVEQRQIEQAGAHAQHQESGDAPPVGKRRRNQCEIEERQAGEAASENQQEGEAAAQHDGPGEDARRPRFQPPG